MPENRFFLDSNIPLYSFDDSAPKKQTIAKVLVRKARVERSGCISDQVVRECLNVLLAKRLLPHQDIRYYLETVLEPLAEPVMPILVHRDALVLQERWRFGFYDALIVASALMLGCDRLYSEDFQHGQRIEGLTIVNPFADV